MKSLVFQVEFLSDIVLPASSNTEGNIEQLDFIPGSNFLGMVAREYTQFENSFDVFHSGKVRFGDATVLSNGKQTYKMPLAFFHEKLNTKTVFVHHNIEDFSSYKQLKQMRNGYITGKREVSYISYSYAQKSAYDKVNRRSLEGSMFGYTAIKSGSKWQFTLQYDEISLKDLERIQTNLLGIKRLGKSKSAQYGEVKISLNGDNEVVEDLTLNEEVTLYVKSRLALVDQDGNASYDLSHLCEGLGEENIVYEKTQLRTSTFTPYNGVRETKDYERVCINKGSVIVLKNVTKEQLACLKLGVGAYLSEGFGELLINPSFLQGLSFEYKELPLPRNEITVVTLTDETARFLQARKSVKMEELALANEVHIFIVKNKNLYSNKMNAQWGSIRSMCANTVDICSDVEDYITHGVAKDKWKGSKQSTLLAAMRSSKNALSFTKLLAMQMPKVKDEESKNEN